MPVPVPAAAAGGGGGDDLSPDVVSGGGAADNNNALALDNSGDVCARPSGSPPLVGVGSREAGAPPAAAAVVVTPPLGKGVVATSNLQIQKYGQATLATQYVQPHGVTMVVDQNTQKLVAISANCNDVLQLPKKAEQLVNTSSSSNDDDDNDTIYAIFDESSRAKLRAALVASDPSAVNPLSVRTASSNLTMHAILHRSKDGVVVDLEPVPTQGEEVMGGLINMQHKAMRSIQTLQKNAHKCSSDVALAEILTQELRALTGYDRCMCYRFEQGGHGEVIAESAAEHLDERFLNLHFPSTDIPKAMRANYVKMRSRVIADVRVAPVHMVCKNPHEPAALAQSQLRAVAGCHGKYLENMGVRGTLVLSILVQPTDGIAEALAESGATTCEGDDSGLVLWGMIVCHHQDLRTPSYTTRASAECLVQAFGLQLASLIERTVRADAERIASTQAVLASSLAAYADECDSHARNYSVADAAQRIIQHEPGLLEIADADGVCVISQDGIACSKGAVPSVDDAQRLRDWLARTHRKRTVVCDNLSKDGFEFADQILATAAGMFAVLLDESQTWLICFRKEVTREIAWAGDTRLHTGTTNGSGARGSAAATQQYLTPRASFDAYKEMVGKSCRPWSKRAVHAVESLDALVRDASALSSDRLIKRLTSSLVAQQSAGMQGLASAAAELGLLMDHVPVISVNTAGVITALNRAAEMLTGCSSKESTNRKLSELDGVLRAGVVDELLNHLVLSFGSSAAEQLPAASERTLRVTFGKPSGSGSRESAHSELLLVAVPRRGPLGNLLGLDLLGQDASESRHVLDQLAVMSDDNTALLMRSPSPVITLDEHGIVKQWNPAISRLTGLAPGSAVGQPLLGEVFGTRGLLRVVDVGALTKMQLAVCASLDSSDSDEPVNLPPVHLQFQATSSKGGNWISMLIEVVPRAHGVFITGQDTTGVEAAAASAAVRLAAEAASRVKANQLSYLCKEISSPLNGLVATVSAMHANLGHEAHGTGASALLCMTMTCTESLRRIVDTIVDLNGLEGSRAPMEQVPPDSDVSGDVAVVWFRRDLRVDDNPALAAAARTGKKVLPIFIWEPEEHGQFRPGRFARWWLVQSLKALEDDLRALGMPLIYARASSASRALAPILKELNTKSLFYNRLYDAIGMARDAHLKQELASEGITVSTHNADLLYEPWEVFGSRDERFRTFEAFWSRVQCMPYAPPAPQPSPASLRSAEDVLPSISNFVHGLDELEILDENDAACMESMTQRWVPGAKGARRVLDSYLRSTSLPAETMDGSSPSQLSAYIHFGEISVRRIFYMVKNQRGGGGGGGSGGDVTAENDAISTGDGSGGAVASVAPESMEPAMQKQVEHGVLTSYAGNYDTFLRNLGMREWSRYLSYFFPFTHEKSLLPQLRSVPWNYDHSLFHRWKLGTTGYPLVDAAMRQLWSTGWIPNRMRVVTASFLVKHLLLPWQWGLHHFWECLVDADLESDMLGWQYVSGCLEDGHSFAEQIDLDLEARRFDPNGNYVRRWITQLSRMPLEFIHKPWKASPQVLATAGVMLGAPGEYSHPIVDPKESASNLDQAVHKVRQAALQDMEMGGSGEAATAPKDASTMPLKTSSMFGGKYSSQAESAAYNDKAAVHSTQHQQEQYRSTSICSAIALTKLPPTLRTRAEREAAANDASPPGLATAAGVAARSAKRHRSQ